MTAATASSVVAPGTRARMASNSASVKRRVSNTRCGDTTELKRVAGRFCGRSSISLARATAAGATAVAARSSGRARRSGAVAEFTSPRRTRPSRPGAGSANQGSGGGGAPGLALVS